MLNIAGIACGHAVAEQLRSMEMIVMKRQWSLSELEGRSLSQLL